LFAIGLRLITWSNGWQPRELTDIFDLFHSGDRGGDLFAARRLDYISCE
jgi:hypothetical protein